MLLSQSNTLLIDEMNQLLESVFIQRRQPLSLLAPEVIARFLMTNKIARDNGNRSLEQTQLLIGKACDERCKEKGDDETHRYFIKLIRYVHLYDDTREQISRLAFMEELSIETDMITSLHKSKQVFDMLEKDLFQRLFLTDLFASSFIGSFGRRRIKTLTEGLNLLSVGTSTESVIMDKLFQLEKEQKLLMYILDNIRDNIRNHYTKFASKNDLEILKRILTIDLRKMNMLSDEIPDELFSRGIDIIKKESIYYNNLLPLILRTNNRALREEFIVESGLDLFYIEEIEDEYCNTNHVPRERLTSIR